MLKNTLYCLIFVSGLASCATKNDQNQTKELKEMHVEQEQLIENDSLAFLLGTQLEDFVQSRSVDSFNDELIENLHSYDQAKDTIRTFLINGSKFKKYLYGGGKETLIYAEIDKENERVSDLIRIGINKEELSQVLKLDFKNDNVTISNQDHSYLFFFYFDKEKLSGITFGAYTD